MSLKILKKSPEEDNARKVQDRRMRNVIVHDYGGTDIEQVYSTIQNNLPGLKAAFLDIKKDLLKNDLI